MGALEFFLSLSHGWRLAWADELGAGPQAGPTHLSRPSAPGPGPDISRQAPHLSNPPVFPEVSPWDSRHRF